jgi:hypothetical protein
MTKLTTNGATLREVTGWDEIDYVADEDEVVVHFGHAGSPYALWTDPKGAPQNLGSLTTDQLVCLGDREGDQPETRRSFAEAFTWARTCDAGEYLARYSEDDLDDVSDSGSRCGFDDLELDDLKRELGKRGMTLEADDEGLVARELAS